MWQQWLNMVLGLWIILSAYLGMTVQGMTTNLTLSGILIAGLALWGALKAQSNYRHEHDHHREHKHGHA
jgi:hypothetical protein